MKKIIVAALLLLLMMPFTVNAHTALTSSNPAAGERLAGNPEEVELVFGTIIEEGSTMTLKGPEAELAVNKITLSGNVMKGLISEPLVAGEYIIYWKIIGEDGHPIEGEVPFRIDAAAAEKAASEKPAEETVQEEEAATSSAKKVAAVGEEEAGSALTIFLLIAVLVLIGFGIAMLMKKKR